MSLAFAQSDFEPWRPGPSGAPGPGEPRLDEAISQACRRIAPLWPLSRFIAVNPFLGFSDAPFAHAVGELRRLTGARALMPRAFYREAMRTGRISPEDLAAALARAGGAGLAPERLLHAVAADPPEGSPNALLNAPSNLAGSASAPLDAAGPGGRRVATVAEVLDALSDGDRQVSRTAFMIDEISRWCAGYFDEGQATWPAPWRDMPLYAAWRWAVRFDGNAKAMGVEGLAETAAALPKAASAAVAEVLRRLEIPADQWADYLYRALHDIRGWAAYVRRLDWEAELAAADGRPAAPPPARLVDLLAIRVVWGYALFRQRRDPAFTSAWRTALACARMGAARPAAVQDDLSVDLLLQDAYEHAFQRGLIETLSGGGRAAAAARPDLQAVFCIDVRSEPFRRALETVWPGVETFGFAGFFGMPLAYGAGGHAPEPHCPALARPGFIVRGASPSGRLAGLAAGAGPLWTQLKSSAVSCFGFVEAFGLVFGAKIAAAAAGSRRARRPPATPALLTDQLDLPRRIELAEGALRGMSLLDGFARLVLFVGHGSSTVNNPHAAGLDCGACGGHSGAPNARFAARLLNDPQVRAGLAGRGIGIPSDTWFAAALHDTTTDALWLLDAEAAPPSHALEWDRARRRLEVATRLARAERAPRLGLSPDDAEALLARSGDWSQVRPEWGLARAGGFIAAPRAMTAGRDLEGRVFLHSYDRTSDPDLKVLEMILAAPMVVASWITLQYYGSTVDNAAFGAGDKTLHNVCGRIGVLEGNGGDLRAGLSLQSVHDGARFVHEPMRLSVFVAAAPEAIAEVLARRPEVRALIDNGWVHLFSLDDHGRTTCRYAGALAWEALP